MAFQGFYTYGKLNREKIWAIMNGTTYGSGFILKDNLILTNYHVVEDATEVLVTLSDRRQYVAEIIGVDPLSDLAVLKVDGKKMRLQRN